MIVLDSLLPYGVCNIWTSKEDNFWPDIGYCMLPSLFLQALD